MIEDSKFGTLEAVSIATIGMVSKVFYTNVGKMVDIVGTAAWQGVLVSCTTALFFFSLIYLLMRRFPGMDLLEVFEAVLGKFLAVIAGIFLSAYAIFYSGSNLREFVEMIKAYNLPYTPTSLIVASVIIVSLLLCYLGLECLARVSVLCLFPVIAGIIFILLLAIGDYDPLLIRPFWGYGIMTTLKTGLMRSSGYSEVIILAVIVKSLQSAKNFKKAGFISIGFTGLILAVVQMLYVMTFGYTGGREKISGLFEISRNIYFNRFFQRIESIFLFTWVLASVMTVAVSLYLAVGIYCRTFKLKKRRPVLLPVAFLAFMTAMLPNNLSEVIEINIQIIRQYSFLWLFILPAVVLLIAAISGKRGGNAGEKQG